MACLRHYHHFQTNPSTTSQELRLSTNKLSGPIPEGWQLPRSLQVRGQGLVGWQNVPSTLALLASAAKRFIIINVTKTVGAASLL